jgi:toxin ParE1/3/4
VKLSVSEEAENELEEAIEFFAKSGGIQLGLSLAAEFERTVSLLQSRPLIGPQWLKGFRKFGLRRFPFSVIYVVSDVELRVLALAHFRRRPRYWAKRK